MSDTHNPDPPPFPRKPGQTDKQYAVFQKAMKAAREMPELSEAERKEFEERKEKFELLMKQREQEAEQRAENRAEKLERAMTKPAPHQQSSASSETPARLPEVMTIEQAAEYLQLHRQVLYRYVREGVVPAVRIGGSIRFKKSVLDTFLEHGSWEHVRDYVAYSRRKRTREKKVETEEPAPRAPRRQSEDID